MIQGTVISREHYDSMMQEKVLKEEKIEQTSSNPIVEVNSISSAIENSGSYVYFFVHSCFVTFVFYGDFCHCF